MMSNARRYKIVMERRQPKRNAGGGPGAMIITLVAVAGLAIWAWATEGEAESDYGKPVVLIGAHEEESYCWHRGQQGCHRMTAEERRAGLQHLWGG
jgi:hypothetical protein